VWQWGNASAVWVMLTMTVSATCVNTTFGSWVGSAFAPPEQALSAMTRMPSGRNQRCFSFVKHISISPSKLEILLYPKNMPVYFIPFCSYVGGWLINPDKAGCISFSVPVGTAGYTSYSIFLSF
jgi:hypothetical protein